MTPNRDLAAWQVGCANARLHLHHLPLLELLSLSSLYPMTRCSVPFKNALVGRSFGVEFWGMVDEDLTTICHPLPAAVVNCVPQCYSETMRITLLYLLQCLVPLNLSTLGGSRSWCSENHLYSFRKYLNKPAFGGKPVHDLRIWHLIYA